MSPDSFSALILKDADDFLKTTGFIRSDEVEHIP